MTHFKSVYLNHATIEDNLSLILILFNDIGYVTNNNLLSRDWSNGEFWWYTEGPPRFIRSVPWAYLTKNN